MSVLFFITTLVIDITIIIMSSHKMLTHFGINISNMTEMELYNKLQKTESC